MRPAVLGTKVYLDLDIEELLPYIDWNPFFQVWLGIVGRLQLSLSLTVHCSRPRLVCALRVAAQQQLPEFVAACSASV